MKKNFSNGQSVDSNNLRGKKEIPTLQETKIMIDIYQNFEGIYRGESTIIFTEDITGVKHEFRSVESEEKLDIASFLVSQEGLDCLLKTTKSLRDCLLRDPYFHANFNIDIVSRSKTTSESLFDLCTLIIKSKEVGKEYDCSVKTGVPNDYIEYHIEVNKSDNLHVYEIVGVYTPQEITLVNNPNFVTFKSIDETPSKQPARIAINVLSNKHTNNELPDIEIKVIELKSGEKHLFRGIYDAKNLANNSFLIDDSEKGEIATAYNLKACLMRNSFFRNNYEISIQRKKKESGSFDEGSCVELISKGYGEQYDCRIEASYAEASASTVELGDLLLTINPDYINIIDEKDAILTLNYTKGALRSLIIIDLKGKFELDKDKAGYGDFLMVKPIDGKYTLEEARIATLQNIKATMLSISDISEMFQIELNDSLGLLLRYRTTSRFLLAGMDSSSLLFRDINIPVLLPSHIYDESSRYLLELFYQKSIGADSINDGKGDYKIELDVYTDTGVEWGNIVDDSYAIGTYLTTLSKSYFGKPLWFELNTLLSKKSTYSPLFLTAFDQAEFKWIDPGTMSDYRFVARRTREGNTQPIYMSDILYTINGYDYTLNDSHLGYVETQIKNYTLDLSQDFESKHLDSKVSPLTTNLSRTHLLGQKQYINYIIKRREKENSELLELALLYKLYTQSGKLIDEAIDLQVDTRDMSVMNTTQLNLDRFLPIYKDKKVGQIDVCLITPITNNPTKKYVEVSDNISYRILPSALHTLHDFAFLNRLGGWDSMNFGGSASNEFKVTSSTIFKTLQPQFKSYTEIESVSSKAVEEKLTIQTSPITREVVEWLREMSASPAVYELSTRRYVLVDDMTLKYNSKDDLFQIDMKYHYSDVFNGRMK